jgi:hypothetical protein
LFARPLINVKNLIDLRDDTDGQLIFAIEEHPEVATRLNNLAGLYRAQGQYAQAELLYKRDGDERAGARVAAILSISVDWMHGSPNRRTVSAPGYISLNEVIRMIYEVGSHWRRQDKCPGGRHS